LVLADDNDPIKKLERETKTATCTVSSPNKKDVPGECLVVVQVDFKLIYKKSKFGTDLAGWRPHFREIAPGACFFHLYDVKIVFEELFLFLW
jgi:hypothetical protein